MDSSSEWKRCVQQYCGNFSEISLGNESKEEKDNQVRIVKNAIQRNDIQLIDLVKELEYAITSTDLSLREKGVKLLSEVITSLPKDFLTVTEVTTMVEFMIYRLADHHTIVPHALQSLCSLSQCRSLTSGISSKIISSIFKEVHVPSQLQNDRYAVYQIIATLLQSHLEDLRKIDGMVFGFIQVLDGERDPRCLILAFHIIPEIIRHFDLGPFVEDFFEVMACYFPIDFHPRSDQNTGITKQNLAAALHKCLLATPKFAQYLIPLLLEKLESDVATARMQAYHVLEASCRIFDKKDFEPFMKPLWVIVRKEVFMNNNKELENAALKSLTALIKVISPLHSEDDMAGFLDYLEEIVKECEHHLHQPELMLVPCSTKILSAVVSASMVAADKIFSSLIPLLLQQYAVLIQSSQRKAILDMTVKLVTPVKQICFENGHNPLEKFRDSILSLFFSVLDDSSSQELSILGLCALCESLDIKFFLEERHLELLAHHLIYILASGGREHLRSKCHDVLSKLSSLHPTVTLTHILPVFKKQLYELDTKDTSSFNKVLDALISASSHADVLKESLKSMIMFLDKQLSGEFSSANSVLVANSLYQAITCHLHVVSLSSNYIATCLIEPLIQISVKMAFTEITLDGERLETIEVICDAIHQIICISDFSVISPYFEPLVQLHIYEKVPETFLKMNLVTNLQMVSPMNQIVLLLLLKCVLSSMPPSNNTPHISDLLEHLKTVATQNEDLYVSKLGAQCISIIINKLEDHDRLQMLLNSLRDFLIHIIQDNTDSGHRSVQNALLLWIWISKALVLRSHPQMTSFVTKLISWFENSSLGSRAAEGISTIVEDSPKVFSTAGHAHVMFLYRQRFFIETSPQLCKGYTEATQDYKSNYMVALCSQLKHLPKAVLISELPLLLPIMLQSLNHNVVDLQLAVLTCLEDIAKDNPPLLSEHLSDLVPQLLLVASSHTSMKARIHSLSCLASLCSIPGHFIFPWRHEVIRKLKPCLDDKKRLVRKAAVEARCKWFLIGQPGS